MKEFFLNLKTLGFVNAAGSMAAILSWLKFLNVFLGFVGGILAVIAGAYLVAIRINEWKHRRKK